MRCHCLPTAAALAFTLATGLAALERQAPAPRWVTAWATS